MTALRPLDFESRAREAFEDEVEDCGNVDTLLFSRVFWLAFAMSMAFVAGFASVIIIGWWVK